jgi:hypothetical protein
MNCTGIFAGIFFQGIYYRSLHSRPRKTMAMCNGYGLLNNSQHFVFPLTSFMEAWALCICR